MEDKRELMYHHYGEYVELQYELFDELCEIIIPGFKHALDQYRFQDWHWDSYDNSFELDQCDNDLRLTEQQFRVINEDLGFHHGWLNHLDGMETYYGLNHVSGEFVEARRVSPCRKS